LQLAQLELARATELLRQRTIRSPIKGIVVAGMLGPGEYAFDQAQLVTISQIDPLNVEVFVPLSHRSIAKAYLGFESMGYIPDGEAFLLSLPALATIERLAASAEKRYAASIKELEKRRADRAAKRRLALGQAINSKETNK
jgi:multidrug efflux pump subunit AcrA (membrane-fusion protein)